MDPPNLATCLCFTRTLLAKQVMKVAVRQEEFVDATTNAGKLSCSRALAGRCKKQL